MRPAWLLIALLAAASTVEARGDEPIDRQLDLRNASEASGNYYVIFCARKSKADAEGVGHAFVVWAKEDEVRQRSSAQAFGFYPAEGEKKKAIFSDVEGALVDEALKTEGPQTSLITHRLVVRVNRKAWEESQKEVGRWKTSDYNLFANNCTHFAHAVAFDIGLIVDRPDKELPSHYLSRLVEAAKKSQ